MNKKVNATLGAIVEELKGLLETKEDAQAWWDDLDDGEKDSVVSTKASGLKMSMAHRYDWKDLNANAQKILTKVFHELHGPHSSVTNQWHGKSNV
jgi:hypothetical protein